MRGTARGHAARSRMLDADQEIPDIRAGGSGVHADLPRPRARCRNRIRATRARRRSPRARHARRVPASTMAPASLVGAVGAVGARGENGQRFAGAQQARGSQCQMRIAAAAPVTRRQLDGRFAAPHESIGVGWRAARRRTRARPRPRHRRNASRTRFEFEAVRTRAVDAPRAPRCRCWRRRAARMPSAIPHHRALTTPSRSRRDRRRARRR